jgi:isocitrate dehydrogenase (NAD+)
MFEAIHGSAPRMVDEGRAQYADPTSMLRASVLLLEHIGQAAKAAKLERALDICAVEERRIAVTGRDTGCTGREFAAYVLETVGRL